MRCKVGDIAIVVRSTCGNNGKILTCLRLATASELKFQFGLVPGEMWVVDADIKDSWGGKTRFCHDHILSPIRDQPGEDETLAWCPVPGQTVEVAA